MAAADSSIAEAVSSLKATIKRVCDEQTSVEAGKRRALVVRTAIECIEAAIERKRLTASGKLIPEVTMSYLELAPVEDDYAFTDDDVDALARALAPDIRCERAIVTVGPGSVRHCVRVTWNWN